jgi:hypothetical protein
MPDDALPLSAVLREEYIRLHGPLPPATLAALDAAADEPARLKALYAAIHALKPGRTALSISGGGIRSATFALGVMQRLARLGLLTKFDYLSTVSGGGYIGGWLSSFVRRNPDGMAGVAAGIGNNQSDPISPEIAPLTWLRQFSNYLTPKLGLMSGDTWAFVGSYLRNLLLNLLMFVPLLAAVLSLPRLAIALLRLDHMDNGPEIGAAVAGALILLGTAVVALTRPVSFREKGWLTNGRFQRWVLLPYFVAAVFLVLYWGARGSTFASWGYVYAGLIGISIASSLIYMIRFFRMMRRQRVADVAYEDTVTKYGGRKLLAEVLAAAVSGAVAAALLQVSATQLFDRIAERVTIPTLADWLVYPPKLSAAHGELFLCFGVPLVFGILFLQSAIFVGGGSWFSEDYDREWWGRAGGWVLLAALAWLFGTAITIYGPVLIYEAPRLFAALGASTGLVSIVGGKSGKTGAKNSQDGEKASPSSGIASIALGLIAPVFALCILALISLVTSNILLARKDPPRPTDAELAVASIATHQIAIKQVPGQPNWNYQTSRFPAVERDRINAAQHLWVIDHTTVTEGLILVFGLSLLALFVSYFIGANQFSMHALYRNRLIRGYLAASRTKERSGKANAFTGFDPHDNLPMHRLRPEILWATSFGDIGGFGALIAKDRDFGSFLTEPTTAALAEAARNPNDAEVCHHAGDLLSHDLNHAVDTLTLTGSSPEQPQSVRNREELESRFPHYVQPMEKHRRPMHMINMALNLVGGDDLAWQERKAESFTVSPVHSGSFRLGYRPTLRYGGPTGVSLGTSVAISGAAASPNMGYHSSPALSFLLTLFNVRLGWWLGNPKKDTYVRRNPSNTLKTVLDEAFGVTNAEHDYIYLSDGGHFENLGIYEMILRRCHCIVVTDAGADASFGFEDLGNAIRKIRIDFGINVVIEAKGLFPRSDSDPKNPKYCAVARIQYSDIDGPGAPDGHLLYLKPAFYGGDEPKDVYNYAKMNASFPHQSTGDQWFSESQFESYRQLGYFALGQVSSGKPSYTDICDLIAEASAYLEKHPTGTDLAIEELEGESL